MSLGGRAGSRRWPGPASAPQVSEPTGQGRGPGASTPPWAHCSRGMGTASCLMPAPRRGNTGAGGAPRPSEPNVLQQRCRRKQGVGWTR